MRSRPSTRSGRRRRPVPPAGRARTGSRACRRRSGCGWPTRTCRPDRSARPGRRHRVAAGRACAARRPGGRAASSPRVRPAAQASPAQTSAENRTPPSASCTSGHTRAPCRSSMPAPIWARSPMTASSSTVPAPIRAPNPTTLSRTTRPVGDLGPVEDHRSVDGHPRPPRPAPAPIVVPPSSIASGATTRSRQDQASPVGPGQRIGGREAAHQVGRAGDEVARRAQVAPVARVDVADDPGAGGQQLGERLALDRHRTAGRDRLDDLAA